MKHFGSLCIFLILIHFSTQNPKYVNCPENMMGGNPCECCEVQCLSAKDITLKACPVANCPPGTQIGYHEDKTKEYPGCCGYPICNSIK
ncbi:uncharacterized protein LOC118646064 [Monomorium pharaonis]|uniref:uncharacterized protein LOC118646064 n=1 Tax=Monomorium pharaonis TaxID=307658 RepID=UPI001746B438|nr:uncharacterized protein LOC118646064 [Monomorium pharaonis]